MIKIRNLIVLGLLFHLVTTNAFSQQSEVLNYPEVGKPMPYFVLRNISYYSKTEATLDDFKGKWLLLDFWNRYCEACIASFPTTNKIQEQLGDKVQVMLVGIQDAENQIPRIFAKYREKQGLNIPCAFDSLIANRFDIYVAPHIVLIDDKGIVQCITSSINSKDIREFLAGNPPILPRTYRRMHDTASIDERFAFNEKKPFLINSNGGKDNDFLFRSILAVWDRNKHFQYTPIDISESAAKDGRFQVLGATLEELYDYAYFGINCLNGWNHDDTIHYGKYYYHPILEIKDSSRFKFSHKYSRNIFSYSLIVPAINSNQESLKRAIQRDLEDYFGYKATIELRKCPYWKLVANEKTKQKLRTKGGESSLEYIPHAGFTAHNYSFTQVTEWLKNVCIEGYFEDATDISYKIDITLDCIPSNLNDVKKSLSAYGLDLVQDEKVMAVIVIRDGNQ